MGMNSNISGGDFVKYTGSGGSGDNEIIYTSSDVSKFNYHVIHNGDADGAIDVEASIDNGTTYALVHTQDTQNTALAYASTIPATEIGILRGKFTNIRIRQAGATAVTGTSVKIAHGVE